MKKLSARLTAALLCVLLALTSLPMGLVFAAELENLAINGGLDSPLGAEWKTWSSAGNAALTRETEAGNSFLRFNGAGSTATASLVGCTFSGNLDPAKRYYYSFRARLTDSGITENRYILLTSTNRNTLYQGFAINGEWQAMSGFLKPADAAVSLGFSIGDSAATVWGHAVPQINFDIDDLFVCDFTDGETFSPVLDLQGGVTLKWLSGVLDVNGSLYAIPGSTATFALEAPLGFEVDVVTVNDQSVIGKEGVYSLELNQAMLNSCTIVATSKADSGVPHLRYNTPENGANNADPDGMVLTAVFDRDMDVASLTAGVQVSPTATFTVTESIEKYAYDLAFTEPLRPQTTYTVTFSRKVTSAEGIAMEQAVSVQFTTVAEFKNLIENGDMSDTSNLAVYNDSQSGSLISFAQEYGDTVLRWNTTWRDGPISQYLNGDNRKEKYSFIPGHKYYVKARIKADAEMQMAWRFITVTSGTTTAYPTTAAWETLPANEWKTMEYVYTIPGGLAAGTHGIRLTSRADSGTYPHIVYIDDLELYDCSTAPAGTPELRISSPADGDTDIEAGKLNMTLNFTKPMLPTTLNTTTITASGATVSAIAMSADKRSCIVTLEGLRVNRVVTVQLGNGIQSMTGEALKSQSITFHTREISTRTPVVVTCDPADGDKVTVRNLNMTVVFDLPMEGPFTVSAVSADPADLIKEIQWDANKPETLQLMFDQSLLTPGQTYSVTLLPQIVSQAGTPIEAQSITFQTMTTADVVEAFKEAAADTSPAAAEKLLKFMREFYGDLDPEDTLCSGTVLQNEELAARFAARLLQEGVAADADAEEIINQVWSAAVLTIANHGKDADMLRELIETAVLTEEKVGLAKTYGILSVSVKEILSQRVIDRTAEFQTVDSFADYVEEQIILDAFANSNGWKAVSDIFANNPDFFSASTNALVEKVNQSSKKSEIYAKLQCLKATRESMVYQSLNSAYQAVGTNAGGSGGSRSGSYNGAATVGYSDTPQETQQPQEAVKPVFRDIDGVPWAKEAIEHFYVLGVINGKDTDLFYPNDTVTREEFVKMLIMAGNVPMGDRIVRFSDVSQTDWFYPYIVAGVDTNLIQGMGDNSFGVGQNITRQDIAVICSRLLAASEDDEEIEKTVMPLLDLDAVSDYAVGAVRRLIALEIIQGNEDQMFEPMNPATRAEAAVLLRRLIALKNKEGR